MISSNTLWSLVKKEFIIEFRQKSSFGGILLFIICTIFICYLSFKQILNPQVWNSLFWIIFLFTAIITTSKSFLNEQRGREIYNYQLYSPQEMIFAKTFYNVFLLSSISMLTLFFFAWFLGSIIEDYNLFVANLLLCSSVFSAILTLTAGIVNKANGNFTLMAVISFPLTLPVLLICIKVGKNALLGLDWVVSQNYLMSLCLLNLIVYFLAYLLFPYLWKD